MIANIRKTLEVVGKWVHENQGVFVGFFGCLISAEVYLFPKSADIRLFTALAVYWIFSVIGRLSAVRALQLCLLLFSVMSVSFLFSGAGVQTERIAVWFILFLALGVITQWREMIS